MTYTTALVTVTGDSKGYVVMCVICAFTYLSVPEFLLDF